MSDRKLVTLVASVEAAPGLSDAVIRKSVESFVRFAVVETSPKKPTTFAIREIEVTDIRNE